MKITAAICALVALLAACGQEDDSPALEPAPTSTTPTTSAPPPTEPKTTTSSPAPPTSASTTSTTESSAPTTTEPDESEPTDPASTEPIDPDVLASNLVQSAIADLRERLGDPEAEITVVSVEAVTWPDGSVGCPQPGMVYTQALVDGSRIVLSHDGAQYHYHQADGRAPFYCPRSVAAGEY